MRGVWRVTPPRARPPLFLGLPPENQAAPGSGSGRCQRPPKAILKPVQPRTWAGSYPGIPASHVTALTGFKIGPGALHSRLHTSPVPQMAVQRLHRARRLVISYQPTNALDAQLLNSYAGSIGQLRYAPHRRSSRSRSIAMRHGMNRRPVRISHRLAVRRNGWRPASTIRMRSIRYRVWFALCVSG